MSVINISSCFLLLPLAFISTNIYEKLALFNIVLVSWLYHSNREIDALNNTYLRKYTANLYYIDRLQIQLGFTYIFIKDTSLSHFGMTFLYIVSIHRFQDTNILGMYIISKILSVLISKPYNIFIISIGIILAYSGYNGNALLDYNQKITKWSEIKKCVWHSGMGILVTGLLL